MEKNLPEEYQLVLVERPDGRPCIAYRKGTRWYGYTFLEWLDFEPTDFTPVAQLTRQSAIIAAQAEVIEAHDDWLEALDWLAQDVPAPAHKAGKRLESARAKLEEVQRGNV